MALNVANVDYNTDTFLDFIDKFNLVVDALENDVALYSDLNTTFTVDNLYVNTITGGTDAGNTGPITITSNVGFSGANTSLGSVSNIHTLGANASHYILAANNSTGKLRFIAASDFSGANTGFDADKLDGQHGSYYLNANNFTGTLPNAVFPSTLPTSSGTNLSNLNASSISSGTLSDNRLPSTQLGKKFTSLVTIEDSSPAIKFTDTDSSYDFWTHVNGGSFYILVDRDGSGSYEAPHPLQLRATDNTGTLFGSTIWTNSNLSPVKSDVDTTITSKIIGSDTQRDAGMYGVYDSSKVQHIWSMGSGYKVNADGSGFGNIYGLAYYHVNNGAGTFASNHQVVFVTNGTVRCALGSNLWTSGDVIAYSDARVKKNLTIIENPVEKIQKINGYVYDRIDTGERQMGVVAQELMEVLPELVHGDEKAYSVAYDKMAGVFVEAIKELANKLNDVESKLEQITNKE